jgi:hypothetical protein
MMSMVVVKHKHNDWSSSVLANLVGFNHLRRTSEDIENGEQCASNNTSRDMNLTANGPCLSAPPLYPSA